MPDPAATSTGAQSPLVDAGSAPVAIADITGSKAHHVSSIPLELCVTFRDSLAHK
jgi:hypothetical protein